MRACENRHHEARRIVMQRYECLRHVERLDQRLAEATAALAERLKALGAWPPPPRPSGPVCEDMVDLRFGAWSAYCALMVAARELADYDAQLDAVLAELGRAPSPVVP